MRVTVRKSTTYASESTSAAVTGFFFPRSFFAGVGLGSLWAARRADTRASAAVRRSGRYPLLAVALATTRCARRLPDRARIVDVEEAVETP